MDGDLRPISPDDIAGTGVRRVIVVYVGENTVDCRVTSRILGPQEVFVNLLA